MCPEVMEYTLSQLPPSSTTGPRLWIKSHRQQMWPKNQGCLPFGFGLFFFCDESPFKRFNTQSSSDSSQRVAFPDAGWCVCQQGGMT